ncbi:MAG: DUF3347 domain-containing protein [Saprospiraceae bacterium]
MKMKIFFLLLTITMLISCTHSATPKDDTGHSIGKVLDDSGAMKDNKIALTDYASPIKDLLEEYMQLKNALAADNGRDAASAGNRLVKSITEFNIRALPTDIVRTFNDLAADAKEQAEHIGVNAGHLKHQREHFEILSKDIYEMVKTVGTIQTLYYDYCPMYNDRKGANWLSETEEISNPYMGKSMPKCGIVQEEIK